MKNYPKLLSNSWAKCTPLGLLFVLLSCFVQAQQQARQSDAFVETIGIGGRWDHSFNTGTFPDLKSALQKLKIRYIRGGVTGELDNTPQETYNAEMRQMALDFNVKICGLVSWDSPEASQAAIERLGNVLYALEGPNEAFNPPDWAWDGWKTGNVVDVQRFIWDIGRPKGLDIYSWTLGGPMSGYEDEVVGYRETNLLSTHANAHPYHWYTTPGIRRTTKMNGLWQDAESSDNKGMVDVLRRVMGNPTKPLVATEWGWSGDLWPEDKAGCGCQVIPEASRAKYYTRNLFENFNAGLVRSFLYSMNSHGDYHLRDGGNLRPSGQAISDIITLTEDRGAAFTPGSLNYSLSVASGMSTVDDRDMRNDEIHRTLLQKRDGKFLLILWADKDSHEGETGSEAATLTLPGGATQVRIFKPVTNGTAVVSTLNNIAAGGTVNLSGTIAIPDHPIIIEITPGAAAPDLVVSDITWTPATPVAGNAVTFSAVVRNQGAAATPAGFAVRLTVNGATISTITTTALAAGASRTVTATSNWTAVNGSHSIVATADINSAVSEINETNNNRTENLSIGVQPGIDRTDAGGTIMARGENAAGGEGRAQAFDNNNATKWLDFAATTWIQFRFSNSKKFAINQYTITSANDEPTRDPRNWTLRGSNDGTTWTTVDTRSNETFASRFLKKTFSFTNNTGYEYYRLEITSNGASITQLAEMELFGPEVAPAVTYYRIRSRWQNTYLYDGGAPLRYGTPASTDQTSQWTFEAVEGFTRIRNRSTGEYVHIENLLGYVQSTNQAGWSSQWTIEDYDGHKRFKNRWQPSQYIHLEDLTGNAQYGDIRADAWSSQWAFEQVTGSGRIAAESTNNESLVRVFPNPVSSGGSLQVSYYAKETGQVRVELVDMVGRRLVSREVAVKQGANLIELPGMVLQSGVLNLLISSPQGKTATKVVVNR